MSVYSAAKKIQVPLTTFRDRVDGRISIDVGSSGPPQEQESYIFQNVKTKY